MLKAVRALESYLTNNRAFIPNYGERYRKGENHFDRVYGISRQPGGEQARGPTLTPSPLSNIERGLAFDLVAVVSRHAGNTRNGSRIASDFFWSRGKPHSCEIVTEKHVADGDNAYVTTSCYR